MSGTSSFIISKSSKNNVFALADSGSSSVSGAGPLIVFISIDPGIIGEDGASSKDESCLGGGVGGCDVDPRFATAPHLVLGKLVSCNSSDSETDGDLLPGSGCTLSNGTVDVT